MTVRGLCFRQELVAARMRLNKHNHSSDLLKLWTGMSGVPRRSCVACSKSQNRGVAAVTVTENDDSQQQSADLYPSGGPLLLTADRKRGANS